MIEKVLFPWPHFVVVLELSRHAESGQFNAPAVEKHWKWYRLRSRDRQHPAAG
jgi:hypothetical protein